MRDTADTRVRLENILRAHEFKPMFQPIVDLRSLVPLDFDTVAASIRRTGRCVVLHEGPRSLGYGAGLAARIQEELFYELEAPVLRACGFDTPYPPARLEKLWLPGPDRLLDCVERVLEQP